jgi:hypothetical protein
MQQRLKPILWAVACLTLVWALVLGGQMWARASRMTADKVAAYLRQTDLRSLSPADRAKALQKLAKMLNALGLEERRTARLNREWRKWLEAMTDAEKEGLLEATLPTGVKQMLGAFEEMPEDKRAKAIDDALKRLQEARQQLAEGGGQEAAPPVLSEEARQKLTSTGLKVFYTQSSAQTKAELAPVLEELQRMMDSGAFLRGRHLPHD